AIAGGGPAVALTSGSVTPGSSSPRDGRSSAAASSRANSNGSGRNPTRITTPATAIPTPPSTNGPVSSGIPHLCASTPAGPARFGPATAPIVVAQTTIDRCRARWSGVARSVAAYLDWLLAAVVAPSS